MNYNKKQMQPLIDKYGINPETNKLFIKACEMFDGQSNYQLWAVKMIFSQSMTFEELERIHSWISENSNMISKLSKKNIVSYSKKSDIATLFKEIEGINRLSLIKNIISHFNTDQKKILTESILGKDYTPIEAYNNAKIEKWYDTFKIFNKKPMNIKNKFYSTCSALKTAEALHQAILDCLNESYNWKEGKEDLLAFIEHNTKDCKVVFNEGSCVVVRVPSFESSHKLCGNGRTGWCICREESQFNGYVGRYPNRDQYFLFDFSRRESDAFAHVGFTVEAGNGIVEAQTGHNQPMNHSPFVQGNESLSIHDVLKNFGIKMSTFIHLPDNLGFEWSMESFLEMVKKNVHSYAIAYEKNNKLIINVFTKDALTKIINKTFINLGHFGMIRENDKLYLLLDFDKKLDDGNSMIAFKYASDTYGDLSLTVAEGILGESYTENAEKYLSSIGIDTKDFINHEAIDPSILLHKYIDNGNEMKAIELIEKEKGSINVNYEFNQKVPVYSAIYKKMYKLFDVIINQEGFDTSFVDGFGETLLETLLYLYGSEEVVTNESDLKTIKSMINSILSCKTFDLNQIDIVNDTAINTACEYESTYWVVEKLVANKNVEINIVNDDDHSALTNCIENHNLEALKMLGKRPDLVVREQDTKLAKKMGINLKNYIKPTDSVFKESETSTEDALEYAFAAAIDEF